MSSLSKVFVVLIFLLSAAFFGTTATLYKTRTDWRVAYNTLDTTTKAQLAELEKWNKSLHSRLESLDKDRIMKEAGLLDLGNKLQQKENDLKEANVKAASHASNAAKSAEATQSLSKTLESKEASYAQLQETLGKVKSDLDNALTGKADADKRRDSMRLDLEKAQQELHALKIEHQDLSAKYETADLMVREAEKQLGRPIGKNTLNQIDAVVKAVDAKEKLVLLSAGKDQKVQIGDEFTVYRGADFVGKVKVIKVFPDLAGAEIVLMKDGAEIQQGDKATTQL